MGTSSRVRWIAVAAAAVAVVVTAAVVAAVVLGGQSGTAPVGGETGQSVAPDPPRSSATVEGTPTTPTTPTSPTGAGVGTRPGRQPTTTARGNAGDATHPGDGSWVIGTTAAGQVIVGGTYESTVPTGSPGCAWIRFAADNSIITTGHANAGQRATVTIEPTDGHFNTRGCGQWSRVG